MDCRLYNVPREAAIPGRERVTPMLADTSIGTGAGHEKNL